MATKMDIGQLIDERRFDVKDLVTFLNRLDLDTLHWKLGTPEVHERYADPSCAQDCRNHGSHWRPGDPAPTLASLADEPAVMAAVGRCAAARLHGDGKAGLVTDAFHSGCGWCDYPLPQLLMAMDYAAWHARFLVAELLVWRQADEAPGRYVTYTRATDRTGYQAPEWQEFSVLDLADQRTRVLAAVKASLA